MCQLPDGCIDLVVTSPPYNLRNSTGGGLKGANRHGKWPDAALRQGYEAHADNMPDAAYVAWQRACLTEMLRLIPEDGAIFYNHKWRVQRGLLQDRKEIVVGFPVRQIIVWKRKGGVNFSDRFFLPTFEVIYLIAKPEFRLAPRANTLGDVWEIAQERNNSHPAPFPVELPARIIRSTTARSVLDPFVGSGTTAVAATILGRTFLGIDNAASYCEMARERVSESGGRMKD